MGDRWTLELLLAAGPWITGGRTLEDKYLSTYVGAIEMLLKGCTACYDLTVEFPLPSVEGLDACGRAYADAGMRAVLAPMVAELSFYEAIPGLLDALPPALQKEVERLRLAPGDATLDRDAPVDAELGVRPRVRFAPRSRRPFRTTAPTTSCASAPRWRANSTSGCTATCRNPRRR